MNTDNASGSVPNVLDLNMINPVMVNASVPPMVAVPHMIEYLSEPSNENLGMSNNVVSQPMRNPNYVSFNEKKDPNVVVDSNTVCNIPQIVEKLEVEENNNVETKNESSVESLWKKMLCIKPEFFSNMFFFAFTLVQFIITLVVLVLFILSSVYFFVGLVAENGINNPESNGGLLGGFGLMSICAFILLIDSVLGMVIGILGMVSSIAHKFLKFNLYWLIVCLSVVYFVLLIPATLANYLVVLALFVGACLFFATIIYAFLGIPPCMLGLVILFGTLIDTLPCICSCFENITCPWIVLAFKEFVKRYVRKAGKDENEKNESGG